VNLITEIKETDALKDLSLLGFALRVQSLFAVRLDSKKISSEVDTIKLKFFHASDSAPFRMGFGFPVAVNILPREQDKTPLDGKTVFVYRNKETGRYDWHHNELKNVDLGVMATAVVEHLIKWLEEK
jgi:hypothetical protein